MTTTLTLTSGCLFSKWGNCDGDIPPHVEAWLDQHEDDLPYTWEDLYDVWHDVLRTLVRTHLVPFLLGPVEVYDIDTIHNPVRADRVNGIPVDWAEGEAENPFVDVAVVIPIETVHHLVLELLAERREP